MKESAEGEGRKNDRSEWMVSIFVLKEETTSLPVSEWEEGRSY